MDRHRTPTAKFPFIEFQCESVNSSIFETDALHQAIRKAQGIIQIAIVISPKLFEEI